MLITKRIIMDVYSLARKKDTETLFKIYEDCKNSILEIEKDEKINVYTKKIKSGRAKERTEK